MSNIFLFFITVTLGLYSCARKPKNPPATGTSKTVQLSSSPDSPIKIVNLPFQTGTKFYVSQGPFGKNSHSEPGNEYSWDFDVPYGTPVTAMENGRVIDVWEPYKGGVCDPSFAEWAHNIKIEHADGTVAQYVHIKSLVEVGDVIKAGQIIAKTSQNGFICEPQLHVGVYQSRKQLYFSRNRKTIPLSFKGLPQGEALEGKNYQVESNED